MPLKFLADAASSLVSSVTGAAAAASRDEGMAQAMVAVMCGCAYADGQAESAEKAKFAAAIRLNPVMKNFDQSLLLNAWKELSDLAEFDLDTGLDACLGKIRKACEGADRDRRMLVVRMGMAVAVADEDGLEDAEVRFMQRVCAEAGIVPSEVGLPG